MKTVARDYAVDILTSEAELKSVLPEWLTLWRAAEFATPFQSPCWNLAWWDHLNPGGTLAVVTARRDGELVALAPWRVISLRGRRVLSFIGAGVTDCLDLLWRPADEIAFSMMAKKILGLDWDECDFEELSRNSPMMDARIGGFMKSAEPSNVCPVLELGVKDARSQPLSQDAARALGYYRRRLGRLHQSSIAVANEQNIDYLLSELFRLHSEIWSARGQSGVLHDREIAKFHHDAALGFLPEGLLRLYLLKIDGCSAAVFYGFGWRRCTYYYLGGFAPSFARLNPGTIVVGHAIGQAIQEGCSEFNFLRGSESYKYWWGARDHHTYRLRLSRDQFETSIRQFR